MGKSQLSDAIFECNDAACATRLALILARSQLPHYRDPQVAAAAAKAEAALNRLIASLKRSPKPALNPRLHATTVAGPDTGMRSHLRLVQGGAAP